MRFKVDFPGLLRAYQTPVVIHHRTETGKDAYGQPVFTVVDYELNAHFQEMPVEQLLQYQGISGTRMANLFVPLGTILAVGDGVTAGESAWVVVTTRSTSFQLETVLREAVP